MSSRSLFRQVQHWLAAAAAADEASGGPSAFEVLEAQRHGRTRGLSRRGLLGAGGASLLVGCGSVDLGQGFLRNPGGARVVIVGGGLAGLTCCYRLEKLGYHAEIYEAGDTPGGRVRTARGLVETEPAQYAEDGGEFIDSWHQELLDLIADLGLPLIDSFDAPVRDVCYHVDGVRYAEASLVEQMGPVAEVVDAAWTSLDDGGETVSYANEANCSTWDNLSLGEFLDAIDADEPIRKIIGTAYVGEYGLDLDEQSSLNLILMLGTEGDSLDLYGGSDERYKVEGGNDLVPAALASQLADRLHTGRALAGLVENADGSFTLSFESGSDVDADVVVLALPFSVLRHLDLEVDLPSVKRKAIDELGYGSNAKVMQGYSRPVLEDEGFFELYTDLESQCAWDATLGHAGEVALLTNYLGGARGADLGTQTIDSVAATLIADIERVFPGSSALVIGAAQRAIWADDARARGSYPSYKVGQYTGISGAEAEAVGRLIFVGDHTSWDWQGYMNGAVESGLRGAREVRDLLQGIARVARPPRHCRRAPSSRRLSLKGPGPRSG